MRKKAQLLALILCLSAFGVMAIGSSSTDTGETKEIVESTEEESGAAEESSEAVAEDAGEEVAETDVTITEQVLADQDGIKITATEYVTDDIWGEGIKLLIENNGEKTVNVSCDALIVNNYMISDLFTSEIAPGKKANEIMYLSSSELKAAGIESVGQVELYLRVYDSETYDDVFETGCISIQTSAFADMDTTPDDAGMELYNENGIRIVGKTVDENSFWGTAILLYVENTAGKNVGISVEEMSVNGFMMSPFFTTTVYNGKMSLDDITIFSDDLKSNGIESIEEVELKFHIYDADTYETIADTEPITFSAQ